MKIPGLVRRGMKKISELIDIWFIKTTCLGHIDGIAVCDPLAKELSKSTFLQSTSEAMDLIRRVDPRRYRRICREFKCIMNMGLLSSGNYNRKLKLCRVDHEKSFSSKNPTWNMRSYAAPLIHEATHGVLFERGIPYNKQNWERIEKLCRLEETRFTRRVDPVWSEKYTRPFRPEGWKLYWAPPQERWTAAKKRIGEVVRSLLSS